jgi:hypothetical protein
MATSRAHRVVFASMGRHRGGEGAGTLPQDALVHPVVEVMHWDAHARLLLLKSDERDQWTAHADLAAALASGERSTPRTILKRYSV